MQPRSVDVFKAWAVYFPLKCVVVLSTTRIGEGLGVLGYVDRQRQPTSYTGSADYLSLAGALDVWGV